MQFLTILHGFVLRGAQFVIATHSPIIMAYPDALIYRLDGNGIREVAYKETEHFKVTREFLSNPERLLSTLLLDKSEPEPPETS
jgi:predicted ATPase